MTPRLTDQTVRALPFAEQGQRDYHDDAVPGLCLRVGAKSKTFRLVLGTGRGRQRHTLGRYDPPRFTLAKAREKARDLIAARRLAPEESGSQLTFAEARQLFLATYRRKESTRYETTRLLTKHFASLDDRPLAKLKARHIAEIADGLKPAEGKHALTAAKTLFRWCAGREYIDRNPLANLAPLRAGTPRDRVLTSPELAAIWQTCSSASALSPHFVAIVKLAVLTGQRIGQLAATRGEMIDRDKRTITWPGELMKGNRSHTIPYGDISTSIITGLSDAGLLFPTRRGEPFNAWGHEKHKLDKACPLPHWTLHDLRRTYSTIMASLDIAPHIIERLLDHKGGTISGVAAIYNRFRYEEACRRAVITYEEYLCSSLGMVRVGPSTSEGANV